LFKYTKKEIIVAVTPNCRVCLIKNTKVMVAYTVQNVTLITREIQ